MNNALRVSEDLTTIGQVRWEQLEQAQQEGFRSVLNLRSPDELGFWKNEQEAAESLGLHYVNLPLKLEKLDEAIVNKILRRLDQLPKPVLIHCAAGMRSAAIAFIKTAIQEGLTPEQTFDRARSLGFYYVDCTLVSPHLKQRFVDYVEKYATPAVKAA